jgi:hypothetical protein
MSLCRWGTRARFPCSVICKDSAVRCSDDAIDQLRRRLTAQEMLPYDRDGKLGNQKLRETYLLAPLFPKNHPRPSARSSLYALGHFGYTFAQLWRPLALQEILSIIKQQQARLVRMLPDPGRGVERSPQPVAGAERSASACLEFENGLKPKRPKQNIPGGKAMIERAGRRSEAFADGRNGHSRHAPLCDDCQSCSEKIVLAELRMTHVTRIRLLDDDVNICVPAMRYLYEFSLAGAGFNQIKFNGYRVRPRA